MGRVEVNEEICCWLICLIVICISHSTSGIRCYDNRDIIERYTIDGPTAGSVLIID